jgi:VWFA-related protein
MIGSMRFWVACALFVVGSTVLFGQQSRQGRPAQPPKAPSPQSPTFRAGATYVEADVVVTDREGQFVRDLTQDDFQVTEDGTAQPVTLFSLIDIPVGPPAPAGPLTVPPDVASNAAAGDGRLFMVVLDALHVSPVDGPRVKAQALQFLALLGPNDLAAVVPIGSGATSQEFTSNPALLRAAVNRFAGLKLESETVGTSSTFAQANGSGGSADDGQTTLRAMRDRQALKTLGGLCTYMENLRGRRKALVLFSEGVDVNTSLTSGLNAGAGAGSRANGGAAQTVIDAEQDLLGTATHANVSIYAIDPRGLSSGDDIGLRMGPQDLHATASAPAGSSIADEIRRSREPLQLLADATGGLAVLRTNDPTADFQRILDENSVYYLLGYNSTHPQTDGKYRSIAVHVTRPDVTIRTRRGYYAVRDSDPSAGKRDALGDLLANPAPVPGLGLRVTAGALRGPPAQVLVHTTVELDGHTLDFTAKDGAFSDDIDVVYEAIDRTGKVQAAEKETLALRLSPASHDAVLARGVRVTMEFTAPTGLYQLRIAAHERGGERSGSVLDDVEAPDYRKPALAMCPLFVTTLRASEVLTRGTAPVLAAALPRPTTASRTFRQSDVLAYFTEVYENAAAKAHAVEILTFIRNEAGEAVFTNVDPRQASAATAQPAVFDEVTSLPLAKLPSGRYVLTVEARSQVTKTTVLREIPFSVQ